MAGAFFVLLALAGCAPTGPEWRTYPTFIDAWEIAADDVTLTVWAGGGPCDRLVRSDLKESIAYVEVAVFFETSTAGCRTPLMGAVSRPITLLLASPLGIRDVVDLNNEGRVAPKGRFWEQPTPTPG